MDYKKLYNDWLNDDRLIKEGKDELQALTNEEDIEYRFGGELQFGTAGMRGLIGMGTNMMNIYTVARATQGLSTFILENGEDAKKRGVAISYDTRRKSTEFALIATGVLLKNGIKVYLYEEGRPVPMLSYAVRKLDCFAGIMITASHNPKEYNGYKVYGYDGAQMSPEDTQIVVNHINQITDYLSVDYIKLDNIKMANAKGAKILCKSFENNYYDEILKLSLSPLAIKTQGKNIKLVYTPVHGTGYIPVTTILKRLGIKANVVEEQTKPDTEFSTVAIPNPEFKETLSMGIALADKINADVVFGTDPDCDRLGVALRDNNGNFKALSGNQVGVLLLNYILTRLREEKSLRGDSFVVKSFVSTGLAKAVADSYGVELKETPVGFKFIGEKIKQAELSGEGKFEFGFEESCGYLRGTHARDKDAVVASMMFAELVCYYNSVNISVFDVLNGIYAKFGYCLDKTESIAFKGLNAMGDMNNAVLKVSQKKIDKIDEFAVKGVRNYNTGVITYTDGSVAKLEYSNINCLYFELNNGGFVCLRPSGTEPKLKIYYSVYAKNEEVALENYNKLSKAFAEILNN